MKRHVGHLQSDQKRGNCTRMVRAYNKIFKIQQKSENRDRDRSKILFDVTREMLCKYY